MDDVAAEVIAELEPTEGWSQEAEKELIYIAKTLLTVMSTDDAYGILEKMIETIRAEFE